jgi:hypothetical protein
MGRRKSLNSAGAHKFNLLLMQSRISFLHETVFPPSTWLPGELQQSNLISIPIRLSLKEKCINNTALHIMTFARCPNYDEPWMQFNIFQDKNWTRHMCQKNFISLRWHVFYTVFYTSGCHYTMFLSHWNVMCVSFWVFMASVFSHHGPLGFHTV